MTSGTRITARMIEVAVAEHFNYRQNIIVPNIFWGIGCPYEADVVVLRPSGYAAEVEIKISASDIVADTKKKRRHDSRLYRELWFAVPEKLVDHPAIPEGAGILAAWNDGSDRLWCRTVRRGKLNKMATRWTPAQRYKLMELGLMRIWTLKHKLNLRDRGA